MVPHETILNLEKPIFYVSRETFYREMLKIQNVLKIWLV